MQAGLNGKNCLKQNYNLFIPPVKCNYTELEIKYDNLFTTFFFVDEVETSLISTIWTTALNLLAICCGESEK